MGTNTFLLALCLLAWPGQPLLAQPVDASAQTATQARRVDVGGHELRLRVAGSGAPTVVLDSGLGNGMETWDGIFPEVARFARVVAYDRAGYGESEPGPQPRSFVQAATEMHAMLQGAGIEPPYVLVGHSLGGANIRAFAHLFPDDVAGLVFVDPFAESSFASASKEEIEEEAAQQRAALEGAPAGALGEFEFAMAETRDGFPQLASFGAPPDVPMMLLVAGRNRPPQWEKSLLGQYGSWMADATEGGVVLAPDSPHYIHRDDPALVVSAIRGVVFPSIRIALEREIREKGVDAAIDRYREMKRRYPADSFREGTLNALGYEQLRTGHAPHAVVLFRLNTEMFPDSANTYDSLGEAYMAQGDREAAIANYRKSLALDPDNGNATRMLERLDTAH